ncbi:aspartate aminotransferase family protein [Alicyclobacillus shizuokensis]|uniref:aspartate aminotransferase family protein n=1 Tax=Alicyclobacillus shizuokensis TaxID=392014 RepID=UPI0008299271|nr:aspartate aminotransferase family protein [Alicyclobacillus shizuokensis]MCL6625372.1 aspartate aminotransferase family protein [Alicyclobacillus shizuokensis]
MSEKGQNQQATRSALMGNYGQPPITAVRGQGAYLYDDKGVAYLDFTAGIAVCNLGHADPGVTRALQEQAETLVHCSNLYAHPLRERLATRLAELAQLDAVFFCNSGAEANEAAIKLARRSAWQNYGAGKHVIVSLPNGFHGRTLGALSVTPKPAYHEGYAPLLPGCRTPADLDGVLDAIAPDTAACIVEVIQGEGGLRVLPADLLQSIQARCREVGALLIVDEVQTGVGRTGTFFAFEQVGLEPDIVTMAKGLANGVPIGAVLARREVAAAFTPGSHGSTFGGNPLAMAAANAVLDRVLETGFLERVKEVGAYLQNRLQERFSNVSGRGLMWGVDVPDAREFVGKALAAGVLLTAVAPTRVRLVPPLIIGQRHVDELFERLQAAAL